MAYLNLDPDYFDHPKTMQLEDMLGLCTSIYPIMLWCWCARYSKETGILKRMTASAIENKILHWNAEPGKAIQVLLQTGFLDKIGEEYRVHAWKKHEGHLEAFSIRGKKNIKARWQKIKEKQSQSTIYKSDTSGIPTAYQLDTPNLTIPNLTKPITDSAGKPRGMFVVPTLEEVTAYCNERKNNVDASRWLDFYASKGWMIGKNKMKDWRAAVRTWEKDSDKPEAKKSSSYYQPFPEHWSDSVKEF